MKYSLPYIRQLPFDFMRGRPEDLFLKKRLFFNFASPMFISDLFKKQFVLCFSTYLMKSSLIVPHRKVFSMWKS